MKEKELNNILESLFKLEEKVPMNKVLEMLIEGGDEAAKLKAMHLKLKAKRDAIMSAWKEAPDEKAKEKIEAEIAPSDQDFEVSEQEIADARVV